MTVSADSTLRQLAMQCIQSGRLPCDPAARIWGSRGTGAPCALCAQPIGGEEIEYEIELRVDASTSTLQFHLACYSLWRSACVASRAAKVSQEDRNP